MAMVPQGIVCRPITAPCSNDAGPSCQTTPATDLCRRVPPQHSFAFQAFGIVTRPLQQPVQQPVCGPTPNLSRSRLACWLVRHAIECFELLCQRQPTLRRECLQHGRFAFPCRFARYTAWSVPQWHDLPGRELDRRICARSFTSCCGSTACSPTSGICRSSISVRCASPWKASSTCPDAVSVIPIRVQTFNANPQRSGLSTPATISTRDPVAMFVMDKNFHHQLVAATGNGEMLGVHNDVTERIRIVRRLDFLKSHRTSATYEEHAKMLHLIERTRLSEASILLRAHITQSTLKVHKITSSMLAAARDQKLPFVS
jgi:hypothetical protein